MKIVGFATAIFATVGLISLLAWGIANKNPVTSLSGFARVNHPSPIFTLRLFDGTDLSLSSLKGRPVVLNFWASWCAPCRQEASVLESAWGSYKESVAFIGINILDTEETAMEYLEEFQISYPNGRDIGTKIAVEYGVVGLPVTFFVSREGIVEQRWVGAINENSLSAWLKDTTQNTTDHRTD